MYIKKIIPTPEQAIEKGFYSELKTNDDVIFFVFSSYKNMVRFKSEFEEYRNYINRIYENRFKMKVDSSILSAVQLYEKIEHRFFHLIINGEDVKKCQEIKINIPKNRIEKYQELSTTIMRESEPLYEIKLTIQKR